VTRPKVQMKGKRILPLPTLLLSAATGCNQFNTAPRRRAETSPQSQQLKVVATFQCIGLPSSGWRFGKEVLVPPGTEVHEYCHTHTTTGAIATANVLVKKWLGFEEFRRYRAGNSQLQEIDAVVELNLRSNSIVNTAEAHEEHEVGNPHVWLDPILQTAS